MKGTSVGETSIVNITLILHDFLQFVDTNSQPNRRQSGSYSAQYYFLPKFTRIDPPKSGEPNYSEKERSSLVSEFNRAQREQGKPEVKSGSTVRNWLKKHRPKHAL